MRNRKPNHVSLEAVHTHTHTHTHTGSVSGYLAYKKIGIRINIKTQVQYMLFCKNKTHKKVPVSFCGI